MPHPQAFYLHALNIAFQNNFLKLYSFCSRFSNYSEGWNNFTRHHNVSFSPEESWQELKDKHIEFILNSHPKFPPLLKQINYPPLGIYYKGNIDFLGQPLAVVGTRKCTVSGKLITEKIVQELARYNFVIISGLARGIDTIAHQVALRNRSFTIAVLGSGINIISPPSNRNLARKIINQGLLVSEYPPAMPPYPGNFPWRNRIISGLAKAVLVIEAPQKSGALITAKFALEQNRDVFAVPGSILSQKSQGTNYLIQQGAKLIQTTDNILEEFNINPQTIHSPKVLLSPQEQAVYNQLTNQPLSVDKIIANTHLPSSIVLTQLSMLELKQLIKSVSGNYYFKI